MPKSLAHRGDVGEDQHQRSLMLIRTGLAHRGDVGEYQLGRREYTSCCCLAHRGDVGEDQLPDLVVVLGRGLSTSGRCGGGSTRCVRLAHGEQLSTSGRCGGGSTRKGGNVYPRVLSTSGRCGGGSTTWPRSSSGRLAHRGDVGEYQHEAIRMQPAVRLAYQSVTRLLNSQNVPFGRCVWRNDSRHNAICHRVAPEFKGASLCLRVFCWQAPFARN